MLDLKFIRENPDMIRKAIELKNAPCDLDKLLQLDAQVLDLKRKIENLQASKNANAKQVAQAKSEERASLIENGKKIGTDIEQIKPQLQEAEAELKNLLWLVPNIPSEKAPIGKDDSENVEIKRWGNIPQFNFSPLDHVQILEKHNWADLERIANVCGSRTYCLKGDMVLLEMAILNFALAKLVEKKFTLITVPALAREAALYGTGHFPTGKDQVYHLPEDNLYLSGTAEVPVNSLHSGETLTEAQLPMLYGGYSPCFRREAGSAGRDVRGLIRVHQFMKVEQYIICKNDPEESAYWHMQLLQTAEELMQDLELPYRIVECCTGDMGLGKVRMFDIEGWVPSEGKYRETHSCSSLHDWQARRTNLRYRDKDGVMQFCHTLNNTAIATPRILVPFLENHQQQDGSIFVPEKLRKYLNDRVYLGKQ
ncbi:MAG: serS [Chlamydiales bacterium]|jgi:seryl-tRNA synthetase|nr:serS [Chlamydiales bacterium]